MARRDWDERYATGDIPWDFGEPSEHLIEVIRSRPVGPGLALDVGCGTGTNALWLARQGFNVVGIDISPIAVEKARAKARGADLSCRFVAGDFLEEQDLGGPFDLVFDAGCFHVFDDAADRLRFAERVASELRPDGLWLSAIGSTEGPPRDSGPPRRSARDVVEAIEPSLEILEILSTYFHGDLPAPAKAWRCLSAPRSLPAQPSTVR